MTQKGAFCAVCGKSNVPLHTSFCEDCYWKEFSSVTLKAERIELNLCLECWAVQLPSGWTNSNTPERAIEAVLENMYRWVDHDPDVEIWAEAENEPRWEDGKPSMTVRITASDARIEVFPPHEEQHFAEVVFHWGTCKACATKRSGGNVTFQMRAMNRQLTDWEMNEFEQMVTDIVQRTQPNNPMSFVVGFSETRYGLDLKLASRLLAENILTEIKKKWIGEEKKNFKLVGEDKDGIRKYATTYLYRIPGVVRGDFIVQQDRLLKVRGINAQGVDAIDLKNGEPLLIKDWQHIRHADPLPRKVEYLIVSYDQGTQSYELMDLTDYHIFEVPASDFMIDLPIGETLTFLEWHGKLFLTK
ncbi:MAG: hypothetical protein D6732_01420 [Methanobacteriota archaeon]|nr:MAG: hypothetical protein D6732_01420 [Euryarchaeota archaeon]